MWAEHGDRQRKLGLQTRYIGRLSSKVLCRILCHHHFAEDETKFIELKQDNQIVDGYATEFLKIGRFLT